MKTVRHTNKSLLDHNKIETGSYADTDLSIKTKYENWTTRLRFKYYESIYTYRKKIQTICLNFPLDVDCK